MPRVELYGEQKVQARPITGVKRTAAAGGLNNGMAEFGDTLASVAGRTAMTMATAARERADQAAILEATNKYAATENAILFDPNTGAMAVKGKDSQGLLDTVPGMLATAAGEIGASLSNDRQKFEFEKFRSQRDLATDYRLRTHVASEMQQFDQDETKSFVQNITNHAIANADTPAIVSMDLAQVVEKTEAFGRRNGLGKERTAELVGAARTNIHSGVIETFLSRDEDQAASVYYGQIKDQIDGEARAKIEKALEEGTLRGAGQRETDRILGANGTMASALEEVRKITDPKLRDEVQQRVEHGFIVKDKMDRDAEEANLTRLYTAVEKGGLSAAKRDPAWVTLPGPARAGLSSYARSMAEGVAVKTDQGKWYSLMTLASTPATQDEFAKMNLLQFKGSLSNSDFQQLASMQGRIREGDLAGANVLAATDGEANAIIDDHLRSIGIDPTPVEKGGKGYSKATMDNVIGFRTTVRNALSAEEARVKRKLTREEITKTVDALTIRTQQGQNNWIAADVPEQFAYQPHAFISRAADVPAADQQAIRAALARQGIAATDAKVVALFNQKLARLRGERYAPVE